MEQVLDLLQRKGSPIRETKTEVMEATDQALIPEVASLHPKASVS